MSQDNIIQPSNGNVFEDMGSSQPEALEKLIKSEIINKISMTIQQRHLSQKEAATILGVNQPKVSALLNGKLSGFSIERLIRFVDALDVSVSISFIDRKSA